MKFFLVIFKYFLCGCKFIFLFVEEFCLLNKNAKKLMSSNYKKIQKSIVFISKRLFSLSKYFMVIPFCLQDLNCIISHQVEQFRLCRLRNFLQWILACFNSLELDWGWHTPLLPSLPKHFLWDCHLETWQATSLLMRTDCCDMKQLSLQNGNFFLFHLFVGNFRIKLCSRIPLFLSAIKVL